MASKDGPYRPSLAVPGIERVFQTRSFRRLGTPPSQSFRGKPYPSHLTLAKPESVESVEASALLGLEKLGGGSIEDTHIASGKRNKRKMHISLQTWLALSLAAARIPIATAFYPYHYTASSSSNSASNTAHSRRTSYAPSITLPLHRIRTRLRSRQNVYNIVDSGSPSQSNSVAIDQDGQDLSYMVAVTFGDGTEEYHMLLDSAASNTWVMSQSCSTEACKTHTLFGKSDSTTLKTEDTPFTVTYGTGSSSGTLATDTLHLGDVSPTLTFGLATNVSDEFRAYPMDGILGIGRGSGTEGSLSAPQIMDVLSDNKLIGAKMYGIHLSRGDDRDGELNLGEVNKARFSGELNYIDCVENETGFWEVPVQEARVDGSPAVGAPANRTAIMDTGTSFILMPEPDALAIHEKINGYVQDEETFFVPCDTTAVVQFVLNDQAYNISTTDWVGDEVDGSGRCRSNIVGRQTFAENQWLVGDVFLKNVYSVFDFEGSRVGFGVLGGEEDGDGDVDSTASSSPSASASGSQTPSSTTGSTPTTANTPGNVAEDQQGCGTAPSSSFALVFVVAFGAISLFI
ncbi:rhizopuspepsin-1 precursor [Stemphylium lycopersici]|nr:rhizopuspepsin-1 precursor [Stemphylium lycopersici]